MSDEELWEKFFDCVCWAGVMFLAIVAALLVVVLLHTIAKKREEAFVEVG